MCSLWVYVGLAKVHCGATPPSVMVLYAWVGPFVSRSSFISFFKHAWGVHISHFHFKRGQGSGTSRLSINCSANTPLVADKSRPVCTPTFPFPVLFSVILLPYFSFIVFYLIFGCWPSWPVCTPSSFFLSPRFPNTFWSSNGQKSDNGIPQKVLIWKGNLEAPRAIKDLLASLNFFLEGTQR